MAYLNATTAPTLADRFAALMSTLETRRKQRRVYRSTFNELSSLSNRELNDLGMGRSQIRGIALHKSYWIGHTHPPCCVPVESFGSPPPP